VEKDSVDLSYYQGKGAVAIDGSWSVAYGILFVVVSLPSYDPALSSTVANNYGQRASRPELCRGPRKVSAAGCCSISPAL
jgi:hypothetical protein